MSGAVNNLRKTIRRLTEKLKRDDLSSNVRKSIEGTLVCRKRNLRDRLYRQKQVVARPHTKNHAYVPYDSLYHPERLGR
jgi:hypothetical protein